MEVETDQFYSDSLKLFSSFFLPGKIDANKRYPLIIICSGFTGLISIHPIKFAKYFTENGYISFSFDYRGFGKSEGDRKSLLLENQVRDIRHAVTYAVDDNRIDSKKVFVVGWGMGAGLIIQAIQEMDNISALCLINGFYNGRRFQEYQRGWDGYVRFKQSLKECGLKKVKKNENSYFDPFDIYRMDQITTEYVNQYLRKKPSYTKEKYSFEFAESLINWKPEAYAQYLDIPIFIAHSENNKLHPIEEANILFSKIKREKKLYVIKNAGHTEWMHEDHPKFTELCNQILSWLAGLL